MAESLFCGRCGKPTADTDDAFCRYCGAAVDGVNEPQLDSVSSSDHQTDPASGAVPDSPATGDPPHRTGMPLPVKIFLAVLGVIVFAAIVGSLAADDPGTSPESSANFASDDGPRRGATGCTAEEALDTLEDLRIASDGANAIGDPLTIVASGNYARAIVSFQDVRATLADANIPDCGESVRRDMLAAYDAQIDAFTLLSAGGTSDEVATQFELATEYFNRAAAAISTISP